MLLRIHGSSSESSSISTKEHLQGARTNGLIRGALKEVSFPRYNDFVCVGGGDARFPCAVAESSRCFCYFRG